MNKNRSKRSALKLETLEQRQLLATIVSGDGIEVDSNIPLNGNTYDQILLTGSTITVKADTVDGVHQVTRVDFLDADGDIVRAEFSGAGQLTISLADFKAAAAPENYATDTTYVQGNASFRITGSDETTNFTIYSLGSANVHNGAANPIFADGTKTGGNNLANVSRVVIESDGGVLGNAFGGLRAGNAVFGDKTGAVGIIAPEIQFQGPIVLGGINATADGVALLQIGQFSANKVVTLAGTDLSGGNQIDNKNVTGLVMASGQTSMGTIIDTKAYVGASFKTAGDLVGNVTYKSSAATIVLDKDTTKADIAAFADRYLNEIVIEANFKDSDAYGVDVVAKMFGNVTVKGDLGFKISSAEHSIGNVSVVGNIADKGAIVSAGSVGNVSVGGKVDFSTISYTGSDALIKAGDNVGNVTFTGDIAIGNDDNVSLIVAGGNIGTISGAKFVSAEDGSSAIAALGNIGNITFTGDLTLAGGILADGSIGNISGKAVSLAAVGADWGLDSSDDKGSLGSITATGDMTLGEIYAAENIGAISASGALTDSNSVYSGVKGNIGNISAGKALTLTGWVEANEGNIGNLSAADGNLTIGDSIYADGNIGTISTAKGSLAINAEVFATGSIGDISVAGAAKNLAFGANGSVEATKSIGNVTVAAGAITSANTTAAEFLSNKIGNVSVTGDKTTGVLLSDVVFRADGKGATIGNITLDSSKNSAGVIASSAAASTTAVTGTGFSSTGNIGNITVTGHESGKLLANSDSVLLFRAGNSGMGSAAADANAGATSAIGNVNITANLAAGLGSGDGKGLILVSGIDASANGRFVSGGGAEDKVTIPTKTTGTDGSIGSVTINDLGGSGVYGFTSNTLAAGTDFTGGSLIAANTIGALSIEAGTTLTRAATSVVRAGALDIDGDTATTSAADLFVIVV